jgi:acyl-lipid omega-6 desaturase (Delta-12 desaturase)
MTASTVKPQQLTNNDFPFTLRDIIKTLPQSVFIKNPRKAWTRVVINVLLVGLGYYGVAVAPWFLLPVAWIFLGTALTGFFVIGHDCGHRSFSNRNWVNDLVGHLAFLPLIYPFHAWRILHNHHHKHTNKLEIDNAWDVFTPEVYDSLSPTLQWVYARIRGRFWWIGSIGHWFNLHFDWNKFEGKEKEQVRFSVLVVLAGMAIGFPTLIWFTGIAGFAKFWLMPWMVYHFWMSTFTIVHHTIPEIPFRPAADWNEGEAQLAGTVHCDYPWWVEFLCHDINVHVPHHVSTGIPWYNLRQAHASLKENWGPYIVERKFSWQLMKQISDVCHLYDKENNYISFKQHRERSL